MKLFFEQEAILTVKSKELFLLFSSMERYAELHPLIYKWDKIGDNNFNVYEKVDLLGWISIKTSYRCEMVVNAKDYLVTYLAFPSFMQVIIQFSLNEQTNSTRLKEKIEISGFFPLAIVLHYFIRKYHRELFKQLETVYSNN